MFRQDVSVLPKIPAAGSFNPYFSGTSLQPSASGFSEYHSGRFRESILPPYNLEIDHTPISGIFPTPASVLQSSM
jgi:hypothetical protein